MSTQPRTLPTIIPQSLFERSFYRLDDLCWRQIRGRKDKIILIPVKDVDSVVFFVPFRVAGRPTGQRFHRFRQCRVICFIFPFFRRITHDAPGANPFRTRQKDLERVRDEEIRNPAIKNTLFSALGHRSLPLIDVPISFGVRFPIFIKLSERHPAFGREISADVAD